MNNTKNETMNQEKTIEQLRKKLRDSIDRVTRLYPNPRNRNEAVKGCLKRAQNLLTRARPKIEEFKNSIQELNNIADKEEKNQAEAKKQALELAEQEAKEYEKNVKNINNLDAGSIENLAKKAPDYKTKQNIFRPWWAEYNASKDIWEVDSNKLADEIIKSHPVKRLEENGFVSGLVVYLENLGNWARKSKAILNNFIEDAFQYPTDPIGKDSVQQTQYAKDLENAKSVKNTLTLLDGKIHLIHHQRTQSILKRLILILINGKSQAFHVKNTIYIQKITMRIQIRHNLTGIFYIVLMDKV
ncbi:hypothetical protein [Lactobacillus crispatus]|uniref:Uncharacterized protein n=1 Tax=Lactobacillus crispatus TaxID=47770 RepID=A0A7H9EB42_9LACO|nr:hypothetical protein [Lactobacillus crispatus]QLL74597.1 hypothetical protein GTO85_09690 [Lactobacillus crispatus]